jgi:hypothetical protein
MYVFVFTISNYMYQSMSFLLQYSGQNITSVKLQRSIFNLSFLRSINILFSFAWFVVYKGHIEKCYCESESKPNVFVNKIFFQK